MRLPDWPLIWAAIAGGALGAGQVPISLWPLALAGLAVGLSLGARAATPMAGAWRIFAFGCGHFALSLIWITEPFLIDIDRYGWMAPFALGAMAAGFAAIWALGAWGALRLVGRAGGGLSHQSTRMAAVALGLASADLLRSHLFGGFPWALIGHIWLDTVVIQTAAIWGAHGLGLVSLIAAWALGAPARSGVGAGAGRGLWGVLAVGAVALPIGYGAWRAGLPIPPLQPPGAVQIRIVQPDARQDLKWDPEARAIFWQRLLAGTQAPTKQGGRPDLIVWPESAVQFLLEDSAEERAQIAQAAGGAQVLLGIQRSQDMRYFNAMALLDPAGNILSVYDKHHLVPFGEYIPFGDLMLAWFGVEAFAARLGAGFTPGPGPALMSAGRVGNIVPLICYEVVFAGAIRAAGVRPDVLVQATNDAWFGKISGPYQHLALARLRAVEFGLPMLRAANTGISAVIDARGRVLAQLDLDQQGHLDAALPGALPPTPYARWGDLPVYLVVLLGWVVLVWRARVAVRLRNRD